MLLRACLLIFLLLTACAMMDTPVPPQAVLNLTATSAIRATVTPTPLAELDQAPELRDPPHRTRLAPNIEGVRLAWIYYRSLERGEVYEVLAGREGNNLEHVIYSQANGVNLTDWFRTRESGWYHWTVRVMKRREQPGAYQQISYSADALAVEIVGTEVSPVPPTPRARDFIRYIPDGFQLDLYSKTGLVGNTVLQFGPDNNLYVLNLSGTIRRIRDTDGDGIGENVEIVFDDVDDELKHAAGMAFHRDGRLYVSDSGRVSIISDSDDDGILDTVTPIVEGLPSLLYPFHSNNGIAFGPDDKLYITVGSTSDHGPLREDLEASILRINPDGSDLEVFATGFRNPYDLVFTPEGDLFSADNAPDVLNKDLRYLPPEELNHVREGLDYGFPDAFGKLIPADNTSEPALVEFYPSVVTSGITYYGGGPFPGHYHGGLFVAQHGAGTGPIIDRGYNNGYAIVHVVLNRRPDGTYQGDYEDFIQFRRDGPPYLRPVDVTVGPFGNLYLNAMQNGEIYVVSYLGRAG